MSSLKTVLAAIAVILALGASSAQATWRCRSRGCGYGTYVGYGCGYSDGYGYPGYGCGYSGHGVYYGGCVSHYSGGYGCGYDYGCGYGSYGYGGYYGYTSVGGYCGSCGW